MSSNAFLGPGTPPDDAALRQTLGAGYERFASLRDAAPGFEREWKHHGRKYGWKFRVFEEDKSLLEITVQGESFLVVVAARQSEWQRLEDEPALAGLRTRIAKAGIRPEGYGVRVEVKDDDSAALALALALQVAGMRAE